ncbi:MULTISPECIES: DUF5953 family protein [Myxococcus]|uniref:Immunity protein 52 domain-containing protein n=1 Tax=Myxococcus llanfairpwllgwyngyllgogerychwyrndrobwllllantysiliogogogochensis TaxID=2590453 RepID=A0A540WX67_9BACT|nr:MULTISPECIES: DUF5953 family protein [Myxococcus]NTX07760.1 hypothetical protein [Myxococcus sp. CA040A]NTX15994.1 hypothetical protein [Myxococcus sp. CA056]TQF13602.1 hypothetical protein FJV41_22930 [Myxococcus llanfairpwllgwyngyllgogerychwyrndrobwllllantysiliogogogochensis]
MASRQNDLALIVYAPSLLGDEGRALAIIHGMERALPGLHLEWTTSEKEDLIALPNRDEWIMANRTDGGFLFLRNDNDKHPVTIAGWENPNGLAAEGPPHFEVHVDLTLDTAGPVAATDVLEAVAEGARALWGHATPFNAGVEIAEQTSPTQEGSPRPPRGLPALKLPDMIRSPEIPHRLGWLNYWSAATARAIGFPDPARDADLLLRARHTATGGWVVRLTDAPLDLDNPDHLAALLRGYERFPEIGGRSSP